MYDDIIDLSMDQQLLGEINVDSVDYSRLEIWRELHAKTEEEIQDLRNKLEQDGLLTFETIFNESLGYFYIKAYLETQHSIDKAIFIRDVNIFKTLNDPIALKEVSTKIYDTFCSAESSARIKGTSSLIRKDINEYRMRILADQSSISDTNKSDPSKYDLMDDIIDAITEPPSTYGRSQVETTTNTSTDLSDHNNSDASLSNLSSTSSKRTLSSHSATKPLINEAPKIKNSQSAFFTEDSNAIGCYGRFVRVLKERIAAGDCDTNMFDSVVQQIQTDLKLDIFPRFLKSTMFDLYLRCKSMEHEQITIGSFYPMRQLGRGAFGSVTACKKKGTLRLYAMKEIDKRRVQATASVSALIAEKEFLSQMDSIFVTSLKYAFTDKDRLYLVMDLMTGGDLKYHLNRDCLFEEDRARFYCAQILLGLEHIHSKGIIYRDLKLENVLVDERGCVKISDLGLAVSVSDGLVRGYAGTPGYTAPEVVLTQYYSQQVDFFSFGVVLYRTLSGKKPFANRKLNAVDLRPNELERIRKTSIELDRNVVEMVVSYDSNKFNPYSSNLCRALLNKNSENRLGANGFDEIKQHPWFRSIDWGLLENGYLKAPFIPTCEEIHADQQQNIGKPPEDDKYANVKLTREFDASLAEFTFKSAKVIQSELVEVLSKLQLQRRYQFTQNNDKTLDIYTLYSFPTPQETVLSKRHCFSGCIII